MTTLRDLKIAFIGVGHWHVPLYLLQAQRDGITVAAASDPSPEAVGAFATRHGCPSYDDYRRLLDAEKPDFVFAFAPHCDMPGLAMDLIERGIPFTIEKPLGLETGDVTRVKAAADKAGAFCAIPFIWRYSDFIAGFKQLVPADDILHMAFKFVAGPPSRYVGPSPWMLQPSKCGGGCMTNLGVHFIDLALHLTNSDTANVLGAAFHNASEYDGIETYASTLVSLQNGATMALETGYAYPMDAEKRDNRWNIVTQDGYYTLADNTWEQRRYGRETERVAMDTDSDSYYAEFARITLEDYLAKRTPRAGLAEMENVRRVLDAINNAAKGDDA
ncbi:MAG: Gfo/Idh/MocA family oxidoreductase [Planctomycetaceae bacterium]|nr:Gfo/Idh/MocA family oxidoreductase [Planctomycetaceae bacterium]